MNLEDIAKLAGVSRSTVSRVINNDPNVSKRARELVQTTIDKVGYRPNAAARALASHRSHAIGLVVPEDFSQYHVDTWYPLIIEAVLSATKFANQSLMLIMEDTFAPNAGRRVIRQFLDSGRVDGLLILQHSYRDQLTPQLVEQGSPVVLIAESDLPDVTWVDNDNFRGAEMAAALLAESGARTVLAIAGTEEHVPTRRRIEGLRTIFPDADVHFTGHSLTAVQETAIELIPNVTPDAIFAINGWVAEPVSRAVEQLGLVVPDDLLLIAYDDFDRTRNEEIGLTSIVQPIAQLAEGAVQALIDYVEGRASPGKQIVLDPVLIHRGSCRDLDMAARQGGVPTA